MPPPKTSLRPKSRPKKKSFFDKLNDFGAGFATDLAAVPSSMFSDIGMGLNLIPQTGEYIKATADTQKKMHAAAAAATVPKSTQDDDKPKTVADVLATSDDPMADALQKAADDLAKEKAKATEDAIQQAVSKRFRSGARGRRSLLRSRSGGGMGFYNRFET
jgi:hypothetical protein